MKKVFLLSIGLMMAVAIFAQSIKVTPVLKKGMNKTYVNTTAITTMDQTINVVVSSVSLLPKRPLRAMRC